jgi:hypothetical protein
MTKIKDLATVLTDSAFTYFPIDVERYELYLTLKHWHDNSQNDDCEVTAPISGSHTFYSWFLRTQRSIIVHADSFAYGKLVLFAPRSAHLKRYRSFEAMVTWMEGDPWALQPSLTRTELVSYAWYLLLCKMESTTGFLYQ